MNIWTIRADRAFIPASIEMTPGQVMTSKDLPNLFPAGTKVYLADIGKDETGTIVAAALRLKELGYEPVPHIAARRLASKEVFGDRLARLAGEALVDDILVIGGGLASPVGPFGDTMAMLETGLADRYGIRHIGVAGHPEGSRDFTEAAATEVLRSKQVFSRRTDAEVRIVTQFGFDPEKALLWAASLPEFGVDLPVHLGVAGPAKLATLIKYAMMCGVGNSIDFLNRQARSLTGLVSSQSPEAVVAPIEAHWRARTGSNVAQIHVFPFGGIGTAASWLEDRGSWARRASTRSTDRRDN